MKTRTFVSILIFVLTILLISSCTTTIQLIRYSATTPRIIKTIESGDSDKVKRLIEEGADVNAKDNYGNTALMWASQHGYIEVAKLLIEAGADVNLRGTTALMIALEEGHTEIVELLKEAGAKE